MTYGANQPQRINAIGNAQGFSTSAAYELVARENIHAAAREGYHDRVQGLGFSSLYERSPPPWQRNYEIGRLWATGMICCGIVPPDWPSDSLRAPAAIDVALSRINAQIGALRPEIEGIKVPDLDLPVLHEPMRIPRRLLRRAA
jgi:hypothetical protein